MSLAKLFAPPDDPDFDGPMTARDWWSIALEVGVPAVVGGLYGIHIAKGLAERYDEQALEQLDPFVLLALLALIEFGWTVWQAAKKRRGRM